MEARCGGTNCRCHFNGKTMKTTYDWHPNRRGELLMPEGSSSIQQSVQITSMGDVLEKLYREGRLKGQALADATAKYGAK